MKHLGIDLQTNKPLLVGVLNLSPESFYHGSVTDSVVKIESVIVEMHEYGVNCLDLGAMSSRPLGIYGGERTSVTIELERMKELLPEVMDLISSYNIPVSIDTQHAEVANYALSFDIQVLNDISGLKNDPKMAPLLADYDTEIVVMATDKSPGDPCGMQATLDALNSSLEIAESYGIARERLAIDPGFGGWQGRPTTCDLELIQNFHQLEQLSLPIYVGVSRKSTIQTLEGGDKPEDRLVGSIILTHKLIELGAHIVRTHDVKETRLGLNVFNFLDRY